MTAVESKLFRKLIRGLEPWPESVYALGPPAPVEVCQIEAEFSRVLDLYRVRKPVRVLEIGTASGGTLYHWLKTENDRLELVASVDWPGSGYPLDQDQCLGWARDGVTCALIQGDSHDESTITHARELGPFDWLFIDGAHTYTDAKSDWDNYRALCNPGACVLFHDIALIRKYENGDVAGVGRLWRELQAQGFWTAELRAEPFVNAYGIGLLMLP